MMGDWQSIGFLDSGEFLGGAGSRRCRVRSVECTPYRTSLVLCSVARVRYSNYGVWQHPLSSRALLLVEFDVAS